MIVRRVPFLVLALALTSWASTASAERAGPRLGPSAIELPAPISFPTRSAELDEAARRALDRVAALLRGSPAVRLEVQVHSDSQGSDAWNYRLTSDRAEAIRAYLVGRGIAPARVTAQGYGESCPIAPNTTGEGRAANRRVVLLRTDRPRRDGCVPPPPPPPPPDEPENLDEQG